MNCEHKTAADFSRSESGRRIWTCSHCHSESEWTDGHGYHGTIECKRCGLAEVTAVACSPACAAALGIGAPVEDDGGAQDKSRPANQRRRQKLTKVAETVRRIADDYELPEREELLVMVKRINEMRDD